MTITHVFLIIFIMILFTICVVRQEFFDIFNFISNETLELLFTTVNLKLILHLSLKILQLYHFVAYLTEQQTNQTFKIDIFAYLNSVLKLFYS